MGNGLTIAVAQLNPIVGDIGGNAAKILMARDAAVADNTDLVVTSELALIGYPPEDLVLKPAFQDQVESTIAMLAAGTNDGGPGLLVGAPYRAGGDLFNAGYLLADGRVSGISRKYELPNYGVFDEKRLFTPGPLPEPMKFRGASLGVMICEDMWISETSERLADLGAEILLVPNGSPFDIEKPDLRWNLAIARATESGRPIVYANQVGGQDELVFDGASFVVDSERNLCAQAPSWREHLLITKWTRDEVGHWQCEPGTVAQPEIGPAAIYQALLTGLRDYVEKNGFPAVVIGMSGGIDSALSTAIAVDALGGERVRCVRMPSRYTSKASLDDAADCADRLGARLGTVGVEPAVHAFDDMLGDLFRGRDSDVTEENIQARVRGLTLMAISNKFSDMVLTTGNKSEMSVGYATLYGDMCGGFAVLKDVYKTTVYELARWRNEFTSHGTKGPSGEVIPESILTKAPTAELRPNQSDQDSLPPYETLDDILHCLIEREQGIDEIAARGHDLEVVREVSRLLDMAEYKRRQAPPGVKITNRAFGRDRRYPITNAFGRGG